MLAWMELLLVFMFIILKIAITISQWRRKGLDLLSLILSVLLCHTLMCTFICGGIEAKTRNVSLENGKKWRLPPGSLFPGRKALKKVSFAHVLSHPSPIRKSVPPELMNRIKFQSFSFGIAVTSSAFSVKFSNSNIKSNKDSRVLIATGTSFSRFKMSLVQPMGTMTTSSETRTSNLWPAVHVAHFCSHCLREGHLVSSCSNSVCCLWCFSYDHKKGTCFHR
jgi:hypothetical protein